MRKKLIEVSLPLEAINAAAAREKSIRHGHPSTLHLWWARRPLAACRAVLFAQLVDDPGSLPEEYPTPEAQERAREELFTIIKALVPWENSNKEAALAPARLAIARSVARGAGVPLPTTDAEARQVIREHAPPVLDPFCGGGSIPLEAQRLGLEAHASDLNPVAVLITKALIEIPPKFANRPPVNPDGQRLARAGQPYRGAQGLAEDVRYYGRWMRDEAQRRIGHLYPKVKLSSGDGAEATVIAWLWARTVTCPNPICRARMPLVRSFWLSTKPGKKAWVQPVVDHEAKTVRFEVRSGVGVPPDPPKQGRGATFRCLVCAEMAGEKHIKAEGMASRMGAQLMAIVAEGSGGRNYIAPSTEHESVACQARPEWFPDQPLANDPRNLWCVNYGLDMFDKLFTPRQLVALTTFSDLVNEARALILRDAVPTGMLDDGVAMGVGGKGATAYADAVATYLTFGVDRAADAWSTIASWRQSVEATRGTFARQALPVVWDYAEANPFSRSCGNWMDASIDWVAKSVDATPGSTRSGMVEQGDAATLANGLQHSTISTDPPYYDNISYADLSDYFYVWLRRSLNAAFPALFRTMLVPKAQELIASPYRFDGDGEKAEKFFKDGFASAFIRLRHIQEPGYPLTIFYAFKQSESEEDNDPTSPDDIVLASTGWETMLQGLLTAGFSVTGTWPMRTERGARSVGIGTNALASSIVLVCRPRPADAPITGRRDFIAALRAELPEALKTLQQGNIAPVDLAQAAIGPGMAIFSRYSRVLEADGKSMTVRTALGLINAELEAFLEAQEGEMDVETRFCVAWFRQYGLRTAKFGEADVLARAKNASVEALRRAGLLFSQGGDVRLRRRDELDPDWVPGSDSRITDWEATQRLILALFGSEGEDGAAALARTLRGDQAQRARDLAYRLFDICTQARRAEEALPYNALVASWPTIQKKAAETTEAPRNLRLGEGSDET